MGMRRLLVPLLVAAALAHAEDASGACASAVVFEGRVLFGAVVQHPRRLPPRDGELDAIFPACNDTGGDEPDQRTSVLRLRGLPPRVAVAGRGRADAMCVDAGSLVAIGTHPLHAAQFGSPRKPSYRDRRRCRSDRSAVRGRVAEDGVLRMRTARGTVFVSMSTRRRGSPTARPPNPCARASACGWPPRTAVSAEWRIV